jgi:hypothetical protein
MITWTCEGSNQTQRMVMGRQPTAVPAGSGRHARHETGWGLMSAGGPTPYPHIALYAPAPRLICSAPGIPA